MLLHIFLYVQQMEKWGNGRARAYFEAQVPPGYARPSDWSNVHQMTKWIKVERSGMRRNAASMRKRGGIFSRYFLLPSCVGT